MKAAVIIPARYDSTRLPAKPLADLCGKPMVQHVYEQAAKAARVESVTVATDDRRIFEAVEAFGGRALMTSPAHPSGTDRVFEASRQLKGPLVVNLQGDLPVLLPEMLDELIAQFSDTVSAGRRAAEAGDRPDPPMGTLKREITNPEELYNPNIVKVVTDEKGYALYFSRSSIPYVRNVKMQGRYYKHYGIYIYRREFLKVFTGLPPSPLEQMEQLEQLRALSHGYGIRVIETKYESVEVDTPEDLEKARAILSAQRG